MTDYRSHGQAVGDALAHNAAQAIAPVPSCSLCRTPFDESDGRFIGRAEHHSSPGFCRTCVDRCHGSEIADHRCRICA